MLKHLIEKIKKVPTKAKVTKRATVKPVKKPSAVKKSSKTVKVSWSSNHSTAQIYASGVELALCSDDNKQIGPFVYCKDFFQDAIVAYLHKITCGIYGYTYNPKTMPPVPQKNLKVLIANASDASMGDKMAGVADLLHQIEKKIGLEKTVIQQCESPPAKYKKCGIYLLTADKTWLLAPPLLSQWTLLARNGLQHKPGMSWEETVNGIINGKIKPAQKHDKTYLTFAKPGIDLLLEKGPEALFGADQKVNYPKSKAGHIMHHYSGAVSYGSCMAKTHFPKWVYPAKASQPPGICFA